MPRWSATSPPSRRTDRRPVWEARPRCTRIPSRCWTASPTGRSARAARSGSRRRRSASGSATYGGGIGRGRTAGGRVASRSRIPRPRCHSTEWHLCSRMGNADATRRPRATLPTPTCPAVAHAAGGARRPRRLPQRGRRGGHRLSGPSALTRRRRARLGRGGAGAAASAPPAAPGGPSRPRAAPGRRR